MKTNQSIVTALANTCPPGLKARQIIAQGKRDEVRAALGKSPTNLISPEGAGEFAMPY